MRFNRSPFNADAPFNRLKTQPAARSGGGNRGLAVSGAASRGFAVAGQSRPRFSGQSRIRPE